MAVASAPVEMAPVQGHRGMTAFPSRGAGPLCETERSA